jgi:hypothetical protein
MPALRHTIIAFNIIFQLDSKGHGTDTIAVRRSISLHTQVNTR